MEEPMKNPPQAPSMESVTTIITRKRPLENDSVPHASKHFKLRLILRDLRPHFLEVLRTADFLNCKAATEIRGQMKIVVDLNNNTTATQSHKLLVENKEGFVKTPENLPPSGNKSQASSTDEKPVVDTEFAKGTYIIGGSAFGWNFVTFSGDDPVYYGVTKETFRANNETTTTTVVTPVEQK